MRLNFLGPRTGSLKDLYDLFYESKEHELIVHPTIKNGIAFLKELFETQDDVISLCFLNSESDLEGAQNLLLPLEPYLIKGNLKVIILTNDQNDKPLKNNSSSLSSHNVEVLKKKSTLKQLKF